MPARDIKIRVEVREREGINPECGHEGTLYDVWTGSQRLHSVVCAQCVTDERRAWLREQAEARRN